MALDLGNLSVTISADTNGLRQSERVVDQSTRRINSRLSTVDQQAQQTARGGMASLRHAAGQVGFQVQDMAVQLQGGTNAMVVLGQQGSQIASIFGPSGAVVGAIIAVGSAIVGALLPSLFKSKDATIELEEAVKSLGDVAATTVTSDIDILSEKLIKLAKASEQAAKVEIAKGIVDAGKAIKASSQIIEESFSDAFETILGLNIEDTSILIKKAADQGFRLADAFGEHSKFTRTFPALVGEMENLKNEFSLTNDEAVKLASAMSEQVIDKSAESAQKLEKVVGDLALKYRATNSELVEFASKIGKQARSIVDSSDKAAMLEKALKDMSGAIKEAEESTEGSTDRVAKYIRMLEIQAGALGLSGEALAEYQANVIGATGADKEEIIALQTKIDKFNELRKQREDEGKVIAGTESQLQKMAEQEETPAERAERLLQEELEAIRVGRENKLRTQEEFDSLEIDAHLRHQEAMTDITQNAEQMRLSQQMTALNNMDMLMGNVNELIRKSGKEGSAIAKAAFLAQKAIAVAQILVATEQAAANAAAVSAIGGPVGFFATQAGIRATGYASAGLVAGMAVGEVAGAFEQGGIVPGSSFTGDNMIARVNSGEMILNKNQQSKLFEMANGGGGSTGTPNINIVNNGTPMAVENMSISRDEITLMINDANKRTTNQINQSLASGRGTTAQSLQKGFRAERRI